MSAVRPATQADWPAIEALLRGHGLPLQGAREHLEGFLVAVDGQRLLGCAGVEAHGDVGLLRSVAVAPEHRGRGLGAALVGAALAEAARRGLAGPYLLTTTAEAWFPRWGFERIDTADAPAALRASAEFRGACPASAVCMRRA